MRQRILALWNRWKLRDSVYVDAYRQQTDQRVADNPHRAIGGLWEQMGALQRDFLLAHGLKPEHRFLDIGCGTLRGGRHLIPYLNAGRYTGIDLSPACIAFALDLVRTEGLEPKAPRLLVSRGDLRFREFPGEAFDVIFAQSVFTHCLPAQIAECFDYARNVMEPESVFYFTYRPSNGRPFRKRRAKDFEQSFAYLRQLAGDRYRLVELSVEAYPHPRGQRMVEARVA